jgi:hypothetical protein
MWGIRTSQELVSFDFLRRMKANYCENMPVGRLIALNGEKKLLRLLQVEVLRSLPPKSASDHVGQERRRRQPLAPKQLKQTQTSECCLPLMSVT